MKNINILLFAGFYGAAGLYHFINPGFYAPLIPDYLPFHEFINYFSGVAEVVLAVLVIFKPTRKIGAYLTIAMLICFIPSHVYFLQIGGCVEDGLCAPLWLGWVRLLVVHPLLILWAYITAKA